MTEKEEQAEGLDLRYLFKRVWKRGWILLLAGIIGALAAFFVTKYAVSPQYASSVLLYVNNKKEGTAEEDITTSQIEASKKLIKTSGVILRNRATLHSVVEKTGVEYTVDELSNMIGVSTEDDTEVMRVTVTCGNAEDASKIANGIAEVLPTRVTEIVEGSSMRLLDRAPTQGKKVSPNVGKYTVLGAVGGLLLSMVVLCVIAVLDDTIYEAEQIKEVCTCAILAQIPNLLGENET